MIQAAIDAGIARGAVEAALDYVRTRTRPWPFTVETATEDPYIISEVGRLQVDLHAAEEVLARAGRTLDGIAAAPVTAKGSGAASVAVAEAKILTTEIALEASERLLELAGASATRERDNLGRFWRDARVHTLHDPVRWKYHLIGRYHLTGALPAATSGTEARAMTREAAFTRLPAPPHPVPVIADDAAALAVARDLAATFAENAAARDLNRALPFAELERFTESGLWAITVPRAYGGTGASSATAARICALIAAADGSLGQIPQNHYYALEVLRNGGTESQKRHLYGRVLAGERFGNALAEIGGRDHTRRTRLVRDPAAGSWRDASSTARAPSSPTGSR